MASAWLLVGAAACAWSGMAWLALANRLNWQRVRGGAQLVHERGRRLRWGGAVALTLSLLLCLAADHPTMASLVWLMLSSASTVGVAFVLAFRPHALRWLVVWVKSA